MPVESGENHGKQRQERPYAQDDAHPSQNPDVPAEQQRHDENRGGGDRVGPAGHSPPRQQRLQIGKDTKLT